MDKDFSRRGLITQQIGVGFVGAWFAATFLSLILAILFNIYLNTNKVVAFSNQQFGLFAALPDNTFASSQEIQKVDARAKIIEDFLLHYKSPLAGFGNTFIKISDQYTLDYRLLPAIAMQESNAGKKVIEGSYNPFGYGIYGDMILRFGSWEEAIERVGRALREDYLNKGLVTPEQIMAKYTPPSLEKDGAWAKGVSSFMEELR